MLTRTGLLSSPVKSHPEYRKKKPIHFLTVAKPAPFILKPYAGLYNPFAKNCSLLCNHPTNAHTKELLRKAKDAWSTEGKEAETIRKCMQELQLKNNDFPIESVPEELFRKYTETDSRPLTPAPTLTSAHTRASGSRRCVTPEHFPPTEAKPKTQLILDLRRSHSQETLSWYSINLQLPESPKAKEDFSANLVDRKNNKSKKEEHEPSLKIEQIEPIICIENPPEQEIEEDQDVIRKKGRKRRKKRNPSKEPPLYQTSTDPETQIATIGTESRNPSAKLLQAENEETKNDNENETKNRKNSLLRRHSSLDVDSFLDAEILKYLRRELTEEVIEREFNLKRRTALEEAFKTIKPEKIDCEQLQNVKKNLKGPVIDRDFLVSLPRVFSRSSARFELPMDSRQFTGLSSLQYLEQYVVVSKSRQLLYNCIFNRHKSYFHQEQESGRKIIGNDLINALNEVMGKPLNDEHVKQLKKLIGWFEDTLINFKLFCGISAFCERILAVDFCPKMSTKKEDPCQEIEVVDFRSLQKRLQGQKPDGELEKLLYIIKETQE